MGDLRRKLACPKPQRLVLIDRRSSTYFLVAADSDVSFYPKPRKSRKSKDFRETPGSNELLLNNFGSVIQTFGTIKCIVDFGLGQEYSWSFNISNFERPIIGRDFLKHFGLVMNFTKMCLVNPVTNCETEKMSTVPCECHHNKYFDDGWPSVTGIYNKPVKQRFFVYNRLSNLPFLVGTTSQISIFPLSFMKPENKLEPFNGSFEIIGDVFQKNQVLGFTSLTLDFGTNRTFVWKFAVVDGYKPIIGLDFMNHFSLVRKFKRGRFCFFDLQTNLSTPCNVAIDQTGWPSSVVVNAKPISKAEISSKVRENPENHKFVNNNYKTSNLNPSFNDPSASPKSKESLSPRFKKDYKKKFTKSRYNDEKRTNFEEEGEEAAKANVVQSKKIKHRFHVTDINSQLQCLVSKIAISMFPKNFVDEKDFNPSSHTQKIRGADGQLMTVLGWTSRTLDIGLGREYTFRFAVVDVEKPVLGLDFINYFKLYQNPDSLIDPQTKMITAPPSEPCDCQISVADSLFSRPKFPAWRGGRKKFHNYRRYPRKNSTETPEVSETRLRSSTPVDIESDQNSDLKAAQLLVNLSSEILESSSMKNESEISIKILNKSAEDSEAELETNFNKETRILESIISEENPMNNVNKMDTTEDEFKSSGDSNSDQETRDNDDVEIINEVLEDLKVVEIATNTQEKLDEEENKNPAETEITSKDDSQKNKNEDCNENIENLENKICELKIEDITNFNSNSTKKINDSIKNENHQVMELQESKEDFKKSTENLNNGSLINKVQTLNDDKNSSIDSEVIEEKINKEEFNKSDNSVKEHDTSEDDFKDCSEQFEEEIVSNKLKIEHEVKDSTKEEIENDQQIDADDDDDKSTSSEEDVSLEGETDESDEDEKTDSKSINKDLIEEEAKKIDDNSSTSDSESSDFDSQKLIIDVKSKSEIEGQVQKHRFHVIDKNSKVLFFVTEKSQVSSYPKALIQGDTMKDSEKAEFIVADSSLFPILGWANLKLDFGLNKEYEWSFAVTDFVKPIIAQDFLKHFGLECDHALEYSRLCDRETLKTTEELSMDVCDCENSMDWPLLTNFQKIDLIPKTKINGKKIEIQTCETHDECLKEKRLILVDQESGLPCLISEFNVSVYPKSYVEEDEIQEFDDLFQLLNNDNEEITIYGSIVRKIDFGLGRFFLWKFFIIDIDAPIIGNDFLDHYGFDVLREDGIIFDHATERKSASEDLYECQTNKYWPNNFDMKKIDKSSIDELDSEDTENELKETEI
ncbi:uncharacterized protein LOC127278650 [Leptopilina boulardi]|uniref:uncharacterized protein LOC127278650 n=1 Tax=Leptopilina boulardi TaxID=63433 RepID=UPI0021F693CA|nr:uncharacterized protein LOC127278650 [Leptopilina boulardi]